MFLSQIDKWKNRPRCNRNRRVRRRKFAIELLEHRRLLAIVTWDGGAGTLNWTDANNWDNNVIPATVDSVVIPDLVGTPTILYGSGTRTVASIQTAEIVSVTGGSLSINGNLTGVGSLRVAGGTQAFLGTNWVNTSTLVLSSGTLNLGGNFTQFNLGNASPVVGQGTFTRSGGTVNLTGTLTGNLTLNAATGAWTYGGGGRLKDGTLATDTPFVWAGAFTLDNYVISTGSVMRQISNGSSRLTIVNGLTINGELQMGLGTTFGSAEFGSSQTIGGTGAIVFGDNTSNTFTTTTSGFTVTFGANLTLRGKSGRLTYGSGVNYILQGLVQPNVAGGVLTIESTTLSNTGRIEPINGSTVNISLGTFTNNGPINVSSSNGVSILPASFTNTTAITATGGTLTLGGAWSNTGSISVTSTSVTLAGSFTQYGMGAAAPAIGQGTFTRSGGTVNLTGTLTNTGTTLTFDSANNGLGSWNMAGGTIVGGSIASVGLSRLQILATMTGNLTGATISANSQIQVSGALVIRNGLTNNGTINVVSGGVYLTGSQAILGNGEFIYTSSGRFQLDATNTTATIGPGQTIRGGGITFAASAANTSLTNEGTIAADAVGGFNIGDSASSRIATIINAASGVIRASAAGSQSSITSASFSNAGIVSVLNSADITIAPSAVFTNFSSNSVNGDVTFGTLTGGAFEIQANSILRLVPIDPSKRFRVTSLNANLSLAGANSNFFGGSRNINLNSTFDALGSLVSIGTLGNLSISSGREFAPFGVITNSGQLTIDSSGKFGAAQSSPSTNLGVVSKYTAEGNANDAVGTNNATLVNGPTFGAGIAGQAFVLDGVNDYVSIPDNPSLRLPNMSIEGWFKFNSDPGISDRWIFSKALGTSSQDSYRVAYSNGKIS